MKNAVKKEIQKIYDNSKQNYGAPKIAQKLRKSGKTIRQRTVGKYMREMGIRAQWTTTTKDSDFSKELHNILNEQFNPERPNAVWCTDITYIWTQGGFVYLNCVMDLYARKIIAWTLADTMEVSTVIETINKAKACHNTNLTLIIHSDRGSQYDSNAWRETTEKMQQSYSHSVLQPILSPLLLYIYVHISYSQIVFLSDFSCLLLHKISVKYTRLYFSIVEVLLYIIEPCIPCNDVFSKCWIVESNTVSV